MNQIRQQELARALGGEEQGLTFEPVEGGFTGTDKYIVRSSADDPEPMFAKIVDVGNELESIVLDTEAEHYRSLTQLGLAGRFFPKFHQYVSSAHAKALFIDYLPDVRWGGPWNEEDVIKLLNSVNAIHGLEVPEEQKVSIHRTARALRKYLYRESPNTLSDEDSARLFEQAWNEDKTRVVNSRGHHYFEAGPELYHEIKTAAAAYDQKAGERVIIRDTNFNNIAIADDRVIFVDPAYLDIGNPASDMVSLGLNILLVTPDDEAHHDLRRLVKDQFLADKLALSWTTRHLMAIGTLEYGDGPNPWMDYHQSMAEVALSTWQELYGRTPDKH